MAWLVPAAVFVVANRGSDHRLAVGIGAVAAIAVVIVVARRPGPAFVVLVCALPLQLVVLSALFRMGMPASVVRVLASYRDLIVVGVGLAGLREFRRRELRSTGLDKLSMAFLALTTAYLAFPNLFARAASAPFPGAPQDLGVRLLAYRVDVSLVVLMLAMRYAPVTPDLRRRLMQALLVVGAVVAGVTVLEFFASSVWNNFLVHTVQISRYRALITKDPSPNPLDVRSYITIAGHRFVRPGSTLVDPLQNGFYLVLPFGLGLERVVRGRAGSAYALTALSALALLLTNVRAAVIAGVVVCLLAVRSRSGRGSENRVRVALLLAIGVILLLPAATGSGLTTRASNATNGQDQSANDHLKSFRVGVHALATDPLGRGLGTQPGVGDRFHTQTKLTSENAYLQVGNELGIPAMLIFIAMLVLLLRRLGSAARTADPDDLLPGALRGITTGLAVGGLLLHVWAYLPVALTSWGASGLAISDDVDEPRTPALSSATR
jgi:hypothetical protein